MSEKKHVLARLLLWVSLYSHLLTVLLIFIGYGGFLSLPLFDRKNFFDENALLPFSANPTARQTSTVVDGSFQKVYEEAKAIKPARRSAWLHKKLAPLHLQPHLQEVPLSFPAYNLSCQNVHFKIPAPRGDGRECILFVTPTVLQNTTTGLKQTPAAAALVMTIGYLLVQHLSEAQWLAKDLIWLIPDVSCGHIEGTMAWVAAYQLSNTNSQPKMFGRAGLMQQAFVLEVWDARFNESIVSVESFNGQLPKLDIYWLVKSFAEHYVQVPAILDEAPWVKQVFQKWPAMKAVPEYAAKLSSLSQFVWRQAVGRPTGAHAPFKEVGVDAATLRLAAADPRLVPEAAPYKLLAVLDAVESMVRCCNNLLERLHHSYNLYLQTGPNTFVSVDVYVVPLLALGLALMLQASAHKAVLDAADGAHSTPDLQGWAAAVGLVLAAHAAGAAGGCLMLHGTLRPQLAAAAAALHQACPPLARGEAPSWRELGSPGCSMAFGGLAAAALVLPAAPVMAARALPSGWRAQDWRKVKVASLSTLGLLLAAVACMNWALAYLHLVLLVPLMCLCRPLSPARAIPRKASERNPPGSEKAGEAGGETPPTEAGGANPRGWKGYMAALVAGVQCASSVVLLLATSPTALAAMLVSALGLPFAQPLTCLAGAAAWVLSVAPLTLLVGCAVYVPAWLLCLWTLLGC